MANKEDAIQAGDTVRLKSGGPLMTVVADKGERLQCEWFFANVHNTQSFPTIALKKDDGSGDGAVVAF